ncbi:CAAX amino terminal protease self- immunity [bacterium BMS3Abin04]|nr:CAAX amino terminal protease self- immunity [bacterium BMS3Abin04]
MIGKPPDEFRISLYFIFITILLSWPVLFLIDGWVAPNLMDSGSSIRALFLILLSHAFAMFCPAISSIILMRKINNRSFLKWKWSKLKYYIIALIIWITPALMGFVFYDSLELRSSIKLFQWIYMISYLVIVYFSSIGEELGWRAVLLTLLTEKFGRTKSTILSGIYRGVWHLPILVSPLLYKVILGETTIFILFLMSIVFLIQLVISNILFGSIFAFTWYKTQSLPLTGWIHYIFDLLRDFIVFFIIGYGTNIFFKFGWAIPFYFIAYYFLLKIAKEENITNLFQLDLLKFKN